MPRFVWNQGPEATMIETYTFYTQSDDGVRVSIDNHLIIDDWNDHAASSDTEQSGTIELQMGVQYDIEIEYYENGRDAAIYLWWETFFLEREIVPQSQLYSGQSLTPSPTEPPAVLKGDVDCDGDRDIVDALLRAQFYVGLINCLGISIFL